MPEWEQGQIAVASVAAALFGAILAALLVQGWLPGVFDWMRVSEVVGGDPALAPAEFAVQVAAFIGIVAMMIAVVIFGIYAALRRLGMLRPVIALALVLTVVFAIAFAAEAALEVARASDYRTAWDATGLMIEDRRLTAHGWETVARRAAVASLLAGIIATAFGLIRSLQARRSTNH
ncbi:MAG TPA: hypothetical protein VGF77_13080 [Allosphingosinicella sp.]|jgi:MFS superfamily sulfate permease-like transporter